VFFVHPANARTMCIRIANERVDVLHVTLTMPADPMLFELGVRQLAARKPFEGVVQRNAVRILRH
jgi:hypothetical protein